MCMHTTGRATATQYSGMKERAPLPMILELEVGSVDRGASIRDFSQYPDEDEYLFVPLCFVAPAGPQRMEVTDKSALHITPVRDMRVVGPSPLPPVMPPSSFHLQLSFAPSLHPCLFCNHSGYVAGAHIDPVVKLVSIRRMHLRIRCLYVQARVQRAV